MNETQCSTMGCTNRAKIEIIPMKGEWWNGFPNPAPFCTECQAAHK